MKRFLFPLKERHLSLDKITLVTISSLLLILFLMVTSVAVAARVTIDNFDEGIQNLEIFCETGAECLAGPFDSSIVNGASSNILGGQRGV